MATGSFGMWIADTKSDPASASAPSPRPHLIAGCVTDDRIRY
jgi:hypothetical protein